jgi:hypothetical protein
MGVSAIIVTRGDVDMIPVLDSLPVAWEKVVWNNGNGTIRVNGQQVWGVTAGDISVYGRYAAIGYASHELIYVQDDDVVVSDPQAIVDAWHRANAKDLLEAFSQLQPGDVVEATDETFVVCNMPPEFRHDFYSDHALVGFGAAFHRDAPDRAFALMMGGEDIVPPFFTDGWVETFNRCCDVVFTALTPRVLVDVPKQNLPWAEDYSRMYRQPNHTTERMQMLELARRVRDAK